MHNSPDSYRDVPRGYLHPNFTISVVNLILIKTIKFNQVGNYWSANIFLFDVTTKLDLKNYKY